MQKVIDLLEQKVEWIAIGLGFLFMLFMVWSYVLQPPAVVSVGGENLTAGEVDPYTLEHAGKQLESAMTEGGAINIPVPTYVQAFKDVMDQKTLPVAELPVVFDSKTQDVTLPTPPGGTPGPTPGVLPGNGAVAGGNPAPGGAPGGAPVGVPDKVTVLPVPPAPVWDSFKFGRSLVVIPVPGQPMPQITPGQPPPPGAVDRDWLTQLFKINLAGLDQAYKSSKIPQDFYKAEFVQVEMERQEVDADGKAVAPPTTLPTIAAWRNGTPPPPMPGDVAENAAADVVGQQRQAAQTYLAWATSNQPDILEPLYYPVVQGDQWQKPGQQNLANQPFDPANPPVGWEQNPDMKAAVMKYRQDQYKLKQEQQKQSRPAPGPRAPSGPRGGGGPGMEGNFAPNPNYTGVAAAPSYAPIPGRPGGTAPPPRTPPPGIYRGGGPMPGMEGMEGEMPGFPGGGMGGPTPANLPQPGTDYPNGEFNPAEWGTKTIEAWAHDDTAQAGKTYKYRMRYKIKNPVFSAGNVTQPDSLADIFAVPSPWSEWSTPVTIPAATNFFVESSKSPNSDAVHFAVFRWDKGQQHQESFTVRPGDQIGAQKGDVDYSTPWTVVDFRFDERTGDWQILLVNNDGKLMTRSYRADKDDPLYQALQKTVKDQKAAAAVAAGTAVPGAAPAGVGAPGGGPIGAR